MLQLTAGCVRANGQRVTDLQQACTLNCGFAIEALTSCENGRDGRTVRLLKVGSCSRSRLHQASAALLRLPHAIAVRLQQFAAGSGIV